MSTENLAHKLLHKHLEILALPSPVTIESEADFLSAPDNSAQSAIVFLPKSKALIDMTLAFVSRIVIADGTIVLAGTKKGGIESAKKSYEKNIGPVIEKIVGNHSALYVGKNKQLGADKKLEDFISSFPITFKDTTLEIAYLPGVFSAQELDLGTKLLLEHMPFTAQKVLDIGCGAGVIGSLYKKISPDTEVTFADVSELAVYATQKTLEKNNLSGVVVRSDVFSGITDTFDLILCNPPFHTGIETDYSFMERFSREASKHLNPGGVIYIVANSFLSYERALNTIGPTEIIIDDGKFRIFKTTKGR